MNAHNARTSWLGVAAAFAAAAVITVAVIVALGSSAFGAEPSYVPEVPTTVTAATAAVVTPEFTG